jgi:hypothetical protein
MNCECIGNTLPRELTPKEKTCLGKIERPQLKADVGENLFGRKNSQAEELAFPLREMD